jgi:hypothetical protein
MSTILAAEKKTRMKQPKKEKLERKVEAKILFI